MSMTGDIGAQMKSARRSSGLTQDQLAEKLHVTRQTISSWENGRTEPICGVLRLFLRHAAPTHARRRIRAALFRLPSAC